MVDTYLNQYEDASISVSTFNIRSMCEKAIRCVIEDGETKKKLKPNWKTKKNRKTRSSQTALCIIDVQSSFCKILRDADQVSASISSRNSLKYLGSKMILSIHRIQHIHLSCAYWMQLQSERGWIKALHSNPFNSGVKYLLCL